MTEERAAEIIKQMIIKSKEIADSIESSEEYIKFLDKSKDLEKLPKKERQIKEDELDKELNNIFIDRLFLEINVSSNDIENILKIISPDFISKYGFTLSSGIFMSPFENVISIFIDKCENNYDYFNDLLRNREFINVVEKRSCLLAALIERANDSNLVSKFLIDYTDNFSSDVDLDGLGAPLSLMRYEDVLEAYVLCDNYPIEDRISILEREDILKYISGYKLYKIIDNEKFSTEIKLKLLANELIRNKLGEKYIDAFTGISLNSYEKVIEYIRTHDIDNAINFLSHLKLNSNDFIKLFTDDEIISKYYGELYSKFDLGYTLNAINVSFEDIKTIIFNEKVLNSIDSYSVAHIITMSRLSIAEREEIISHPGIIEKLRKNGRRTALDDLIRDNEISSTQKVKYILDERLFDFISAQSIQQFLIMRSSILTPEDANKLILNPKVFYKLIDEYHEVYNPTSSNKGPFKYDKYAILLKLYENNHNLYKTLKFSIFKDDIIDLGFDFIEKISKYYNIASIICDSSDYKGENRRNFNNIYSYVNEICNRNNIRVEQFIQRIADAINDYSSVTLKEGDGYDYLRGSLISRIFYTYDIDLDGISMNGWKAITEIALRSHSVYYKLDHNSLITGINTTLNIFPEIRSAEDLNNYEEKRIELCNFSFLDSINCKDLEGAKDAYFNKYFRINIDEAREIVRLYSKSISQLREKNEYKKQTDYIIKIMNILNIDDIDELFKLNMYVTVPMSFEESLIIDQSIRGIFSSNVESKVYKTNEKDIINKTFLIPDGDKLKPVSIDVYDAGIDFMMLIHSTAAYGKLELINDSYYDSWNKNERKTNHGICCSLIANDNLGMAEVNDVLFGFSSWHPSAMTKMAPYDIYTYNDSYDIKESKPIQFMLPRDIIDNTRHTHNELSLERYELRDDVRTAELQNIQPSYVIIYNDMEPEIIANAIKCSKDMNIPIVYIDKEKILINESNKLNILVSKIESTQNLDEKISLFKILVTIHENNRSGLRITNSNMLDKYFPTNRITSILDNIISMIQNNYLMDNNIDNYYKYSDMIISVLKSENDKFDNLNEMIQRQNFFDIPYNQYKNKLLQFINKNLGKYNVSRIGDVISNTPNDKSNFSDKILSINSNKLLSSVSDIQSKGLYRQDTKNHNIGHIERVITYAMILGKMENLDEHDYNLLIEAAKYHDVARVNDGKDSAHGKEGAKVVPNYLDRSIYSDEDIRIIQTAIEYHEMIDDNYKFTKMCERYNLPSDQIERIKKIAICLKDADALDRVRFTNAKAILDVSKLRSKHSIDLVLFAKELVKKFSEIDLVLFKQLCSTIKEQKSTAL